MLSEKEYRKVKRDSYSSISLFLKDRKKYYLKFCLGTDTEDEDTQALKTGSLVDCLLFNEAEFNDRYIVATNRAPTGQMLSFINALYLRAIQDMGPDHRQRSDFMALFTLAYNDVKYDLNGEVVAFKRDSLETIINQFGDATHKNYGKSYFEELMQSVGKTTISLDEYEKANRVINNLKTNNITKDVINLKSNKNFIVINQLPIMFNYKGYKLKCLPDKIIIDHINKTIKIYDLKTAANVEEFQYNYFKFKYYIQNAVYTAGVTYWKDNVWLQPNPENYNIDRDISSYMVEYMDFIVCDSFNYLNPLIYITNQQNLDEAINGFSLGGKWYMGLDEALTNIKWHKENKIWNVSYNNFVNDGIVPVKLFNSQTIITNEEVED